MAEAAAAHVCSKIVACRCGDISLKRTMGYAKYSHWYSEYSKGYSQWVLSVLTWGTLSTHTGTGGSKGSARRTEALNSTPIVPQ